MIARIRPAEVVRAVQADVPRPVDVLNLIWPDHWESYRWYGLLVAPLVYGLGGSVRWMGRFERSLYGEQQAEKLMVVRYRTHRRFLAMTLNPYYLAINRLRERGVRRFEASFTHASVDDGRLGRSRWLVVAHYDTADGSEALERLRAVLEPAVGDLVYASAESAALRFLAPPRPTDPNPLRFPNLAFFAPANGDPPGDLDAALVSRAVKATDGLSLQLYRREPPQANLPRVGRGRGRNGH